MSKCSGVYIGYGYIINQETYDKMIAYCKDIHGPEGLHEMRKYIDKFGETHKFGEGRYFIGEAFFDIDKGDAHTVDNFAAVLALCDTTEMCVNLGNTLLLGGFSVEEINEEWANPNIYVVHWEVEEDELG